MSLPVNVKSKYNTKNDDLNDIKNKTTNNCVRSHFPRPQDIKSMKSVISRVKGSQPAPILLVANKLDLECQREVPEAEGNIFAHRSSACLESRLTRTLCFVLIWQVNNWPISGTVRSSRPRPRIDCS